MLKYIIIVLFIPFLFASAHDNSEASRIHQRIVEEAYQLLKLQFSKENGFADMDEYLSDVVYGSYIEDEKDLVYGKSGFMCSINHFADADWIHEDIVWVGGPFLGFASDWTDDAEEGFQYTALKKARDYYKSQFSFQREMLFQDYPMIGPGYTQFRYLYESRNEIYYYYHQNHFMYNGLVHNGTMEPQATGIFTLMSGDDRFKKLFFEALGRICHLLADMGVPEHINASAHIGRNSSPFEHFLKFNPDHFFWNAEKIYAERGGLVNPFCTITGHEDNEFLFLFYSLAKLTNNFVKLGDNAEDGNSNYDANIGEIKSILDSYAPDQSNLLFYKVLDRQGLGDLADEMPSGTELFSHELQSVLDLFMKLASVELDKGWNMSIAHGSVMRDVLLPFTIRVTAGMMYRFIIESKMQFPSEGNYGYGTIFDQQQYLDLKDQDINGNYYTFRAEGTPGLIDVCNTSAHQPFTINSESRNVTFRAANEIAFYPGFSAKAGAQVHAYVVPSCPDNVNCDQCLDEDLNPVYDKSGD